MYKSKFEERVAAELESTLGSVDYEPDKVYFLQPEKERYYLPDFKLRDKTYIECKGKWTAEDRAKHVWVKEQHPELTIYILFQNARVKLNKRSKTSYGDWADKNSLLWADYRDGIPEGWLHADQKSTRTSRRKSGVQRKSK